MAARGTGTSSWPSKGFNHRTWWQCRRCRFRVRRAACELTTKNYNKFFLLVIRHLEVKGFSHENLATFLTSQGSASTLFPVEFREQPAQSFPQVFRTVRFLPGRPEQRVAPLLHLVDEERQYRQFGEHRRQIPLAVTKVMLENATLVLQGIGCLVLDASAETPPGAPDGPALSRYLVVPSHHG